MNEEVRAACCTTKENADRLEHTTIYAKYVLLIDYL
jgi:hypothetical protein